MLAVTLISWLGAIHFPVKASAGSLSIRLDPAACRKHCDRKTAAWELADNAALHPAGIYTTHGVCLSAHLCMGFVHCTHLHWGSGLGLLDQHCHTTINVCYSTCFDSGGWVCAWWVEPKGGCDEIGSRILEVYGIGGLKSGALGYSASTTSPGFRATTCIQGSVMYAPRAASMRHVPAAPLNHLSHSMTAIVERCTAASCCWYAGCCCQMCWM
jgi:hypothetical protein